MGFISCCMTACHLFCHYSHVYFQSCFACTRGMTLSALISDWACVTVDYTSLHITTSYKVAAVHYLTSCYTVASLVATALAWTLTRNQDSLKAKSVLCLAVTKVPVYTQLSKSAPCTDQSLAYSPVQLTVQYASFIVLDSINSSRPHWFIYSWVASDAACLFFKGCQILMSSHRLQPWSEITAVLELAHVLRTDLQVHGSSAGEITWHLVACKGCEAAAVLKHGGKSIHSNTLSKHSHCYC